MKVKDIIDKLNLFDSDTEVLILSYNLPEERFELDDPKFRFIDESYIDLFSFPKDSLDKILLF